MGIKIGSTEIKKVYVGSTEIKKVYVGSTLIWSNYQGISSDLNTFTSIYNAMNSGGYLNKKSLVDANANSHTLTCLTGFDTYTLSCGNKTVTQAVDMIEKWGLAGDNMGYIYVYAKDSASEFIKKYSFSTSNGYTVVQTYNK